MVTISSARKLFIDSLRLDLARNSPVHSTSFYDAFTRTLDHSLALTSLLDEFILDVLAHSLVDLEPSTRARVTRLPPISLIFKFLIILFV